MWLVCCVTGYVINSGPRFVLNLIKVFEGSFGGATLYENPNYITPNAVSETFILLTIVVLI
jgi:ribosome biogenesis protein BRX1